MPAQLFKSINRKKKNEMGLVNDFAQNKNYNKKKKGPWCYNPREI